MKKPRVELQNVEDDALYGPDLIVAVKSYLQYRYWANFFFTWEIVAEDAVPVKLSPNFRKVIAKLESI